jgi:hypothetical protein
MADIIGVTCPANLFGPLGMSKVGSRSMNKLSGQGQENPASKRDRVEAMSLS